MTYFQIWALSLASCVTSNNSLNFSKLQLVTWEKHFWII